MSTKLEEKRLKLAAQGLRKTATSLQAAVVSLLQAADALTAETENLVESSPLDVNLQDLLKGDINSTLNKFLNDALNNEGEALDEDQKTQNGKRTANGVKKTTRKRTPRDPNAPTRPQNAFILYQKDVSSEVKKENEGKPWSEIVHLISTRWKSLPKEEKEVYEQRFELEKQAYATKLKAYNEKKTAPVDADGPEEIQETSDNTPMATSSSASSSEGEEEDTPNPSNSRPSRSRAKSTKGVTINSESSKKKPRKRKSHDDDANESAPEEEEHESHKKQKKKFSNEDDIEAQGKKKFKKSPREEEKESVDASEGLKSKKKKNKKNKD